MKFFALLLMLTFALLTITNSTYIDPNRYQNIYPNYQLWRQFSGPRYSGGGMGRMRLGGTGIARMIDE